MTPNYKRVLPRDLFNEANLLKCIGKLTLMIEDGLIPWLSYHYDNDEFNVWQNESNGALYVGNIQFYVTGQAGNMLTIERPLNSRDNWPLFVETEEDSYSVFDEAGNFVLEEKDLK